MRSSWSTFCWPKNWRGIFGAWKESPGWSWRGRRWRRRSGRWNGRSWRKISLFERRRSKSKRGKRGWPLYPARPPTSSTNQSHETSFFLATLARTVLPTGLGPLPIVCTLLLLHHLAPASPPPSLHHLTPLRTDSQLRFGPTESFVLSHLLTAAAHSYGECATSLLFAHAPPVCLCRLGHVTQIYNMAPHHCASTTARESSPLAACLLPGTV
mmetsp:Transcript_1939/g.5364  ORF Transcript_1939/g.5364 Transcript_1939/m.5364 type:complete len:212 (+) Transcript_1939:163-798(+)